MPVPLFLLLVRNINVLTYIIHEYFEICESLSKVSRELCSYLRGVYDGARDEMTRLLENLTNLTSNVLDKT